MKRRIVASFGLLLWAALVFASAADDAGQVLKQKTDAMALRQRAVIGSVTPEYAYPNAINLVLEGKNFPPKSDGTKRRLIRLVQAVGRGDVFFDAGNRSWTASRIETFLGSNVIPGRRYRAGIVEYSVEAPASKRLLTNEVEFLLLIKIEGADPSPVPLGVGEIEVLTANALGPKGSKIVKFAGRQATITKWEGFSFRVLIPSGLARPAVHELFVEDGGQVVSTKLPVKLLGPAIRGE